MNLTRRRFVQTAAIGAAALTLPKFSYAGTPVVRLSSTLSADENSAHYLFYTLFRDNLKKLVGDQVRIDFFPNGQLGKEADVVQQVRLGSIDMMVSGSSIWATALPELSLLDLGFLFDSYDHVSKSIDGGVGDMYNKLLEARSGCSIVGWGSHFTARSVYTKPEVKDMASMKNVKLRVLPTPAFIETFKMMGAIPTPIPFNEVYTAVQTGVVEGFELDAGTILANKLNETVSNSWQTNHLFSPCIAVMGKRTLAKIPKELQPLFIQAAHDASVQQRAIAASKGDEAMKALKDAGIKFFPMAQSERDSVINVMREKLWLPFASENPSIAPALTAIEAARA